MLFGFQKNNEDKLLSEKDIAYANFVTEHKPDKNVEYAYMVYEINHCGEHPVFTPSEVRVTDDLCKALEYANNKVSEYLSEENDWMISKESLTKEFTSLTDIVFIEDKYDPDYSFSMHIDMIEKL